MSKLNRRTLLGYSAAAGLAAAGLNRMPQLAAAQSGDEMGIDPSTWTPEYIKSIAGTIEVDTAAECAKVVPLEEAPAEVPLIG